MKCHFNTLTDSVGEEFRQSMEELTCICSEASTRHLGRPEIWGLVIWKHLHTRAWCWGAWPEGRTTNCKSLCVSTVCPFVLLSSIPSHGWSGLFIHSPVDQWVVSNFCLYQVKLLWIFKSFYGLKFLDKYVIEDSLGHKVGVSSFLPNHISE